MLRTGLLCGIYVQVSPVIESLTTACSVRKKHVKSHQRTR